MKYWPVFLLNLLAAPALWAMDTYDGKFLTIPLVNVGETTYKNVVVSISSVISVNGNSLGLSYDSYDLSTNQLSIPNVQYSNATYTNVVVTVNKVVSVGGTLPNINWIQTSNSVAASVDLIGNYRSRQGFGSFDFFGKGYKSFFFSSGGEFITPRKTTDAPFALYSINNNNQIYQENSPLTNNYIAGFVTNYLEGNFGNTTDSLIFVDQGRESKTISPLDFEDSYLFRLDNTNQGWQVTEFAKDLGRQFWHSSNNPLDINGDGILDFSIANLNPNIQNLRNVLFLSNGKQSSSSNNTFNSVDLTDSICINPLNTYSIGSSALIRLADGSIASIAFPYSSWQKGNADQGSIITLNKNGSVKSVQCIKVRNTALTADLTSGEGFNVIHVLDLNGDGLDDFIALAEDSFGGMQQFKRLLAFTQNKEGSFTSANLSLGLPFTYTLPNVSSDKWSDWVSNDFFVGDINGDGVQDIFFDTNQISNQSLISFGIRGGLLSTGGSLNSYSVPPSKIQLNKEPLPFNGYRYIFPTELNGDGIIDFILVGIDYKPTYITTINTNGQYYKISALLSHIN